MLRLYVKLASGLNFIKDKGMTCAAACGARHSGEFRERRHGATLCQAA